MQRAAIAISILVACGKSEPTEPPKSDDLAEKMRHCPVTLPGLRAELADVDGGVQFTLRGDAAVVAEAKARAQRLAAGTTERGAGGNGKGGGGMRNCPVIAKGTAIEVADITGGITIAVRAADPAKLADLRATSRERFERAPLERASVMLEEKSADGELRLFAGRAADLDGDGALELVAGGFSTVAGGRRSTIRVYRQRGAAWEPVAEAGWDGGGGSLVRNIELADVDGDGKPEVIALGRVGDAEQEAKAKLAVFAMAGGKLVERAQREWSAGTYTHGYGLAVGDLDHDDTIEIVTGGFQFDGTKELGFVRVWSLAGGELAQRTELLLDGQGSAQMRVNDLALGDVVGDRALEIVVAGRRGALKTVHSKDLARRRETGDISIVTFAAGKLAAHTRHAWTKGTSLRLRSVVVGDLDGDRKPEIVVGGQYDADGKVALAMYGVDGTTLVQRFDASTTAAGVTGELKDLALAGGRVLATGAVGDRPGRHGDVAAWRVQGGKLVRETEVVSRNASEETRARALVIAGSQVLTIGFAQNKSAMIGQVLQWRIP